MKKILLCFCSLFQSVVASQLHVYDETGSKLIKQTSNVKEIAACLDTIGVRFEQWHPSYPLTSVSSEAEILHAYAEDIELLKQKSGFRFVDVLRVSTNHPNMGELRKHFLQEHVHDEPEVRVFIEGSGLFFLHVDARVYAVLCEEGDLISIPKNYRHWFDIGANPLFTAIRFFTREDGWHAHFTGDEIAQIFMGEKHPESL